MTDASIPAAASAPKPSLLAADPRVLADPPADVAVLQLGDTRVNLAIRPWANSADVWGLQTSLLRAIKERFDAEGISIALPPREVVLQHDPAPRE